MKRLLFLFLVLTIGSPALGQPQFDGERIKRTIAYLSSDEMQGRETGTPPFFRAAEWIAKQLQEAGLEPAGDEGSFIQKFTIPFYKSNFEYPRLKIGERQYYGEDGLFRVARYSGGGTVTARVAFLGYGLQAPELGLDEYKDLSVKDRFVVVMNGAPKQSAEWKAFSSDSIKIETAFRAGAAGILFCRNPGDPQEGRIYYPRTRPGNYHKNFPILAVDQVLLQHLLMKEDEDQRAFQRRFRNELQQLNKSLSPISRELKSEITFSGKAEYDPQREAWNVIGLLPGSDPILKRDVIVFGAHMDHVGVQYGKVYNGADDNASGTATVIELARLFARSQERPRRSLLFALWGGEEKGLLGSEYFCSNPTVDLSRIVVCFNHDMVGLGRQLNVPGRYYAPNIWPILEKNLPEHLKAFIRPSRGGPGGSDHTPFLQAGIPAFALMTGPWNAHPDYHQPGDDPEKIDAELLGKVAEFSFAAGKILANYEGDLHLKDGKSWYIHKVSTVVNPNPMPLPKNPEIYTSLFEEEFIDAQFVCIPPDSGLEMLPGDYLEQIASVAEELRTAPGGNFMARMFSGRGDRARAIPGLRTLAPLRHDPGKVKIAIKLGVRFIYFDASRQTWAFQDDHLSAEGNNFFEALGREKVLFILRDVPEAALLEVIRELHHPALVVGLPAKNAILDSLIADKNLIGLPIQPEQPASTKLEIFDQFKERQILSQLCLFPDLENPADVSSLDGLFLVTKALVDNGWQERQISRLLGANLNQTLMEIVAEEATPNRRMR